MQEVFKYLDKNGIPFRKQGSLSIQIQEDDLLNRLRIENDESTDKIFYKGGVIASTHHHANIKVPCIPALFQLTSSEQENIAINWVKETTGYAVEEFKTLFELPVLNDKPFLLQVERGTDIWYLVLATQCIDGDLIVREKFHYYHGFIQENFIKTFGQISKITGTVGIDGKMSDFGNLTEVGGNLWFSNHVYQDYLNSISPLKRVKGDLNLKNTHASLSTIEEVGGNLNLRKTTCFDISSLKSVGGNVLISRSQMNNFDFSKVKIGGKIRYFNDQFNVRNLTLPSVF
jgi:hypothetical protein